MKRRFGEIQGHPEGTEYPDRKALSAAGVHRALQAGIVGGAGDGAESIVLSGGYEDDEDYGDVIVYTGHGGNDPNTKGQVADQDFTRGNQALRRNMVRGDSVRVVRGARHTSNYSPADGYRYDGLYRVCDAWVETGKAGYRICRFRLEKLEPGTPAVPPGPTPEGKGEPQRREVTRMALVRDSAVARQVKEIHQFRCQVCGEVLEGPAGKYAEGAHIKPLGRPHNGPDGLSNILCLCPNHHVLLDLHAFAIADDMSLIGLPGKLRTSKKHVIDKACLQYRREHYSE